MWFHINEQVWRRRTGIRELPGCEVGVSESIRGVHTARAHRCSCPLPGGHLLFVRLDRKLLLRGSNLHVFWKLSCSPFPLLPSSLTSSFSSCVSLNLCLSSHCCAVKFSSPRTEWAALQHGALHGPRSSALPVRPLLRHPLQCHPPGWWERLNERQAAELHRAAESGEERRGYNHSHIHHGALLRYLRGGTSRQRPCHVRSGQVNTISYFNEFVAVDESNKTHFMPNAKLHLGVSGPKYALISNQIQFNSNVLL